MPSALKLRTDFSPDELRGLAKRAKDNNQGRRLLSLAAILDGMNRTDAARIGGMDRQTLRDWVHRFNEQGPEGLINIPRLIEEPAEVSCIFRLGGFCWTYGSLWLPQRRRSQGAHSTGA